MSPEEAAEFRTGPHAEAAAKLREYDDRAKVAGLATPPFSHFRGHLEAVLRAES